MGDVIPVDFAALRAKRDKRDNVISLSQTPTGVNVAQTAMLRLCEMQMSTTEFTKLSAAVHDYEVYSQSGTHTQLLVDVYQMLEGFGS
jgi:hypothetical protein